MKTPASANEGGEPGGATGLTERLVGLLAHLPAVVLGCLCLLIIALVGWAGVHNPLPVLVGILIWAGFMFRRGLGGGLGSMFGGRRRTPAAAAAAAEAVLTHVGNTDVTIIAADLVMAGRLSGAARVEVFGQLSGDLQCGMIRVHAGGELRGRLVHQQLGVAPGAIVDVVAAPSALGPAGALEEPRGDNRTPARRIRAETAGRKKPGDRRARPVRTQA